MDQNKESIKNPAERRVGFDRKVKIDRRQRVRAAAYLLDFWRKGAKRVYVKDISSPAFRIYTERRKSNLFLEQIDTYAEAGSKDFPMLQTLSVKKNGRPDKSIPDGARIQLPEWRYLSEKDQAFFYHVALQKCQASGQHVYNFTLRFDESLLTQALNQEKPIDWLTRKLRSELASQHYLYYELDDINDIKTLHIHGACLCNSVSELHQRLNKASRWENCNAIDIQKPYNVANWSEYAVGENKPISQEKAGRVDRKTSQLAISIYHSLSESILLVNRHHPKKAIAAARQEFVGRYKKSLQNPATPQNNEIPNHPAQNNETTFKSPQNQPKQEAPDTFPKTIIHPATGKPFVLTGEEVNAESLERTRQRLNELRRREEEERAKPFIPTDEELDELIASMQPIPDS